MSIILIKEDVEELCHWYENFCLPSIKSGMDIKNNN